MLSSRRRHKTLRDVTTENRLLIATYKRRDGNGELKTRRVVIHPSTLHDRSVVGSNLVYLLNEDGTYDTILLSDEMEFEKVEYPRNMRSYVSTPLPTLRDSVPHVERTAILSMLYSEIGNNWRLLTDVRFKLLGLVPTISGVILIQLLSKDEPSKGLSPLSQLAIACFGFLVTLALYTYERRNSELYDDLVSRSRKIEEELGVDTGQFRGRKEPHPFLKFTLMGRKFEPKFVQHSIALNIVYWSALLGWFVAILMIYVGST